MAISQVRYASAADGTDLAYQVAGDGPHDLVAVGGWLTHLEVLAENPGYRRLVEAIGAYARIITFDKRGVGLSDRTAGDEPATLETRIDDVRAVMAAASSDSAFLFGVHEAGPMCMLLAAQHPKLVDGLILYGTWAVGTADDTYPWVPTAEGHQRVAAAIDAGWGTGLGARAYAPSLADQPWFLDWMGRVERYGATPRGAKAQLAAMAATDVRHILASISVPTVVLHREGDRMVAPENGAYLAEHIPGAQLWVLPGADHWIGADPEPLAAAIERFVTGRVGSSRADRVLATVVFTDIVDSTRMVVELGDAEWRARLDLHDELAARWAAAHEGRIVKSTGDGVLALFDGPARAIRFARDLAGDAAERLGLSLRAGVHTGEVEHRRDDVGGIAVHVGARIGALAGPQEVLVSKTTVDLVAGSGLAFAGRGEVELRGLPGRWAVLALD